MSRAPIHPLMLSSYFSESASQRSIAVAFRFLPAASLFAARACWCSTSVLLLVVSWRCVDMDWDGTEMGYEMLLFALLSFSCPPIPLISRPTGKVLGSGIEERIERREA